MTAGAYPGVVAGWGKRIDLLLRADLATLRGWVMASDLERVWLCVATIVIGAGLYGAAMGCWRSPLQVLFTGIKLPLVILLTTLGNGLLNGMLAPLLGVNLSFRQSFMSVLMTFGLAAVLLGAFSPLAAFVAWNTPPLSGTTQLTSPEYGFLQLTHAGFIACAGIIGNRALAPLLRELCSSDGAARRVLLGWLAANLFLGSQVAWVLRPFIWDPARPVEFIGREYLRGSFYETVFEAARRLLFS
jgi:hypothetical protein